MISHITYDKYGELVIDWIPNFIAEMPLHLQLAKAILTKVYALNIGDIAYLPTSKKLSKKFRVSEYVITQAYDELENFGLVTTINGMRLRILLKPADDLVSKIKLINLYYLKANAQHFLPRNQLI